MATACPAPTCPTFGCHLTKSEGWALMVCCLFTMALVGGCVAPFVLKSLTSQGADFWYTARNSQNWASLAFSIVATSAGGWLLYTPAEAAVVGGWWGLLGYTVAIALGPLFMAYVGPKLREQMPDSANITDWVLQRFGLVPCLYVALILVYYMFIYLVGQLKTMGDMTEMFTGMIPEAGVIPVAAVTLLYTMVGGFPASIATDWLQTVCILSLVVGITFTVWGWLDIRSENFEQVSQWSDRGFEMGVSLCFAVFGAEVFNLAFWQRIYAAKDDKHLRIGFVVGAIVVSVLTFMFGLTGMLLKAQDLGLACPSNPIPPFVFFEVLNMPQTGVAIRCLMYVLVISMIASNCDSFQTAITSVLSRVLQKQNWSAWRNIAVAEVFVLVINIPAILFAIYAANDKNTNMDGLAVKLTDLFSMADILTITLVVPLFSGLQPFVTSMGAMAGMLSGILFIICWGLFEFDTFMGGMEMITLMCFGKAGATVSENGAPACGFYSARAPIMFISIPIVTGVVTFFVSYVERYFTALKEISERMPGKGQYNI